MVFANLFVLVHCSCQAPPVMTHSVQKESSTGLGKDIACTDGLGKDIACTDGPGKDIACTDGLGKDIAWTAYRWTALVFELQCLNNVHTVHCSVHTNCGMSCPSGLVHWICVLMAESSECGFKSRPRPWCLCP